MLKGFRFVLILSLLMGAATPGSTARAETSVLRFAGEAGVGWVGAGGGTIGGVAASYMVGGLYWLFTGAAFRGAKYPWEKSAIVLGATGATLGAAAGVTIIGHNGGGFLVAWLGAIGGEIGAIAYLKSKGVKAENYIKTNNFMILTIAPAIASAVFYTLFAKGGLLISEAGPAGLIHYTAGTHHWGFGLPLIDVSPASTGSSSLAFASRNLIELHF